MQWRWLIGDYVHAEMRLSPGQRREISRVAQARHVRPWTLHLFTLLCVTPPVVAAFAAMPRVLDWMGLGGRNGPWMIGAAIIIVLFWPWSAWAYSRLYGRACRRAMRDLGMPVCVDCGYSLTGLEAPTGPVTCPECGRPQERAVPPPGS